MDYSIQDGWPKPPYWYKYGKLLIKPTVLKERFTIYDENIDFNLLNDDPSIENMKNNQSLREQFESNFQIMISTILKIIDLSANIGTEKSVGFMGHMKMIIEIYHQLINILNNMNNFYIYDQIIHYLKKEKELKIQLIESTVLILYGLKFNSDVSRLVAKRSNDINLQS